MRTTWEMWTYDVWGNEEDGWDVNNRFCVNRELELDLPGKVCNPGHPTLQFTSYDVTDEQVKELFGEEAVVDENCTDDVNIYVETEDGYPLGELHCTSHDNLNVKE